MSKKKIGVVSITPQVRDSSNVDFNTFYDSFGKNTGNYMFTQAMYRQYDADIRCVGFGYDPDEANEELDHIVIPAANWLNRSADWDFLTDRIERTEIPVTVIGIGLQADSASLSAVTVSDSALRFAKVAAKKSAFISARGDFTRDWLHSVGVKNVVTTGCPSLYMKINYEESSHRGEKMVLQSTRYGASLSFASQSGINSHLFRMVRSFDDYMIYQSEIEEIKFLTYGEAGLSSDSAEILSQIYGDHDAASVLRYIRGNGRVFYDIESWSNFVRSTQGVIGTRLHGAILALNSNTPSILIPHDSRTSELAAFSNIPTLSPERALQIKNRSCLLDILRHDVGGEFYETRTINSRTYRKFLDECGLPVNEKFTH